MRNVLFLVGIDDTHKVIAQSFKPKGLEFALQGSMDIHTALRHPQMAKQVVVLGGSRPVLPRIRKPDIIFNCITDADTSNEALKQAVQVIRATGAKEVVNRPALVAKTRRDMVAAALADIPGLVAPATTRVRPASHKEILDAIEAGPGFPAIVRRIGRPARVLLLKSRDDAALLERIACDGSEYYLSRFVDYKDADGLYRRMRLVIVNGHVIPRHRLAGENWALRGAVRETMAKRADLVAEEEQFITGFEKDTFPAISARLQAISDRVKLPYLVVDCAQLPNGDLLVFKADAGGNTLRQPNLEKFPYLRAPLRRIRAAVTQMLVQPNG